MSQNLVIPNKDNPVVLIFSGVDLTLATNIVVEFGSELYQLSDSQVTVTDSVTLTLDLSATSEVGKIFATVTYFDGQSVNGTDITSRELNNLGQIVVVIGTQLVIEDGTIVSGANSFATDAELKAYAALRGLSVPATQPDREALLIDAMEYILSKESQLQGDRTSDTQALPFPRRGVYVCNYYVSNDAIPDSIKKAQIRAAIDSQSVRLLPTQNVSNVQSEKVGELSRSYFNGGSYQGVQLKAVDTYLQPLMRNSGRLRLLRA